MQNKRVVITGLGVLSACGITSSGFWDGLVSGRSGIREVSLFDTTSFKVKTAAEITGFDAADYLGPKGLRTLDRASRLTLSAAQLALDDAGLIINEDNSRLAGITLGSTFGSIASISDFDRDALLEGAQYVNPAHFPNTVINSPASQTAIRFGIRGFNATLATGFCASFDAIGYAADFIRLGRAEIVLAGGVEELCPQLFLGFSKTACLAGIGGREALMPFDKRANGFILGEAACFLVLEELDAALKRNATILAELKGFGRGTDICSICSFDPQAEGLKHAMHQAIESAGIAEDEVCLVSASANGQLVGDKLEALALHEVFGSYVKELYVSALKPLFGETYSASGALQVAAAVGSLVNQIVPPTLNCEQQDSLLRLPIVREAEEAELLNILVNGFAPGGLSRSVVVSKFEG